jgi:hypothetical protein
VLQPDLLEKAVASGLRSLFVGFESTSLGNLHSQRKTQNVGYDYGEAIRRLHGLGVMVNGSFVFGMDDDDPDVFSRTVDWAISHGIETATFHILTPYPGTALHSRMQADGRILHRNWDLYDTRHAVFQPRGMTVSQLEAGYWRAYKDFYRWNSIAKGAMTKDTLSGRLRHFAYAAGWKKFEPLWDAVIRVRRVTAMLPVLETILSEFGKFGTNPRDPESLSISTALRSNREEETPENTASIGHQRHAFHRHLAGVARDFHDDQPDQAAGTESGRTSTASAGSAH